MHESSFSPRLIAWLLVGFLASGISAGSVYVVYRASSATKPTPVARAPLVITPAAKPQPPAPVALRPATNLSSGQLRGQTFLQVGALEPGAVTGFLERLSRQGFQARTAEGPDDKTVRLLIGPLSPAALAETESRLTAAGFVSFPRSY